MLKNIKKYFSENIDAICAGLAAAAALNGGYYRPYAD